MKILQKIGGETLKRREITIAPSLICADMCNLQHEVRSLEEAGITTLHVDFVEPHFSPSMPLGLDVVRQLRSRTTLTFDVHIMTLMNEFFIRELIDIGVDSIVFHVETERHIEKMLQLIHGAGIKAGVALNPATPLAVLDYIAPELDYVLLMLINPGYAGSVGEGRIAYAAQKIRDCRRKLDTHESRARIVIDGRVSFDVIPALTEAGADVLVGGSGSVFRSGYTYAENCSALREMLSSIH